MIYQKILPLRANNATNDLAPVDAVGPDFTMAGYARRRLRRTALQRRLSGGSVVAAAVAAREGRPGSGCQADGRVAR